MGLRMIPVVCFPKRMSQVVQPLRMLPFLYVLIFLILISPRNSEPTPIVKFVAKEESPLYTTIGNISSFLFPDHKIVTDPHFFNVTPNGLVQLTRRLDLEALCVEQFMCCELEKPCELTSTVVIESQSSRDIQTLELRIQVVDINDHVPTFPVNSEDGQTLEISESAKVGSIFVLVPATDRDIARENQIQRYILHGTEIQKMFELDVTEPPNVRLRLIQSLDYEKVTKYSGVLEACDPQNCAQRNLTILIADANDNRPVFLNTSYKVTIPENFTVGHTVIQLLAVDKDSPLYAQMDFRFHGEVDQGLRNTFRLEHDTGRIVLQTPLAAHRRSEYRFDVSVAEVSSGVEQSGRDRTMSSFGSDLSVGSSNVANVIISVEDLNDFSPNMKLFSPSEGQRLYVLENLPATRVCVVQVTDNDSGDNGRVHCHLVVHSDSALTSDETSNAFILTNSGKMYTISTTRPFDAELQPQVTVTLVCTDFGVPPRSSSRDLVIHIDDVNEFPPELEKTTHHTAVYENSEAGVEVVRIVARDRDHNAHLYYELSAEGKQYFKVDSRTGSVTTLGDVATEPHSGYLSSVLDREKSERITFMVCVSDGPQQTVCDGLGLDQAKPTIIATPESDSLVYTVTATVFVTIMDLNDNSPVFIEKGPFSVAENQPRFTHVSGRLLAIDQDEGDNGRVRYSLRRVWKSANGIPAPDLFQVDADGRIQTVEVLDRETTNVYTLELSACDSAPQNPLCTRVNVTVTVTDENDNKPVWRYPHDQDKEVNITADLPPGHIIARVHAADRDADDNGRITYTLIDPLRRTVFQVDNRTGDIVVAHPPVMNALVSDASTARTGPERLSPLLPGIYRLRLRASDQGHPQHSTETWLQVNVFSSENAVSSGMNFMIIVVMVAVTGLISVCLVIAIICVRRRSLALRTGANTEVRSHANGLRRGRDAGDGAEGMHFPLKHEYGYPMDGAGYMMGISPTPSDLDAIKLGYSTTAALPLIGVGNGAVDGPHLVGWTGINPSSAICYPVGEQMNLLTDQSVLAQQTELCQTVPLRVPLYAPIHRLTPTANSDSITMRSSEPRADAVATSVGSHPFYQSYFDQTKCTVLNDTPLVYDTNTRNSGSECQYSRGPQTLGVCGAYDPACSSSRSSCIPFSSGTNSGMIGYCPGTRRLCGLPHCELDVESADSGRGPSEDDPNQLTGGSAAQVFHFYPTYHLASTLLQGHSQRHQSNGSDANAVDIAQPLTMEGYNGGRIHLDLKNGHPSAMTNAEPTDEWNSLERHRLKC